jgi:hypothetical protein
MVRRSAKQVFRVMLHAPQMCATLVARTHRRRGNTRVPNLWPGDPSRAQAVGGATNTTQMTQANRPRGDQCRGSSAFGLFGPAHCGGSPCRSLVHMMRSNAVTAGLLAVSRPPRWLPSGDMPVRLA